MPPVVARIITDIALDREFDYLVPGELAAQVRVGSIVRIPFGRRRARGFVTGLADRSDFPNLKSIEALVDGPALFDEAMLRLARWVAEYYAAPFESAIAAILPAAVRREGTKPQARRVADGRGWPGPFRPRPRLPRRMRLSPPKGPGWPPPGGGCGKPGKRPPPRWPRRPA